MHEGNHLARVQRRAAAKADNAVMVASTVGFAAFEDVFLGGIGAHIGEHFHAQTRGFQICKNGFHHFGASKAIVSDKQRVFHGRRFAEIR